MEFLGRLFAYPDTHRYRLGPNFQQLPINCAFLSADLTLHILSLNFNRCAGPYRARVVTHQRDGPMCMVSKNPLSPALEDFVILNNTATPPVCTLPPIIPQHNSGSALNYFPNSSFVTRPSLLLSFYILISCTACQQADLPARYQGPRCYQGHPRRGFGSL